jgi:single-stranded-DNA-specific exonuclease
VEENMQQNWELISNRRPADVRELLEILLTIRSMKWDHLKCGIHELASYASMKGIDEAAALMARHLERQSKIVLVSDYDCDGITSLAQMSLFLQDIGHTRYETVIPLRAEGYGVPLRAVEEHSDAALLVAMDCGTRDAASISLARRTGMDCIVLDHHEIPKNGSAPATVLVNPKQRGCPSPFKEMCSSGLTLLFLTRLRRALGRSLPRPRLGGRYLQLAALGTIADMVPLIEGNRILAQHGLASLNAQASAPVRRLIDAAGLTSKTITARHVGYHLAPRINAAGRLAHAGLAYDLLMCQAEDQGVQLARELNRLNIERQSQERRIMDQVRSRLGEIPPGRRTLVLGDPEWPLGLVGIIASKIQQEIQLGPVVVLSIDPHTGIARGSARSIPGVDMHHTLSRCGDLLTRWGGHPMAAGLTLETQRIAPFASRLEEVVSDQPAALFRIRKSIDVCIAPTMVTPSLLQSLKELEPHGVGNPTPTFLFRDVRIQATGFFGQQRNHLRVVLADRIPGIVWRGLEQPDLAQWRNGCSRDVVFQVSWDDYRNEPFCDIKDVGRMSGS